ncbi:MAG: succinate dehydrogenase, partial [Sarcina sp.]|nr:succinate dehydrogenase [Sarcina sp.]
MKINRMLRKIILLPVILAVTLIFWICIFLNNISGVIMGILSIIFALAGIASLLFGLFTGGQCLEILTVAFMLFLLPRIWDWLTM